MENVTTMKLLTLAATALLGFSTAFGAPTAGAQTAGTAPAPSTPAATSSAPASPKATTTAKAPMQQAPGGGPDQVWVNTNSSVYHCPGDRFYGKTAHGRYMTEAAAKSAGAKGVGGKTCSTGK